jgi:hypothetical protein
MALTKLRARLTGSTARNHAGPGDLFRAALAGIHADGTDGTTCAIGTNRTVGTVAIVEIKQS